MPVAIDDLRKLVVAAAPDAMLALPVETCAEDQPLDGVIPFSSVIVLGVVVAIEDRYRMRVTKEMLAKAVGGGLTLRRLATMIETALETP
jgi:hypothetical protein